MSSQATPRARSGAIFVAAAVACAAVAGNAGFAAAQELGGGTIRIDLKLYDDDGDPQRVADDSEDLRRFLSLASCECEEPFIAELVLENAGSDLPSEAVHVYVGQECERFDDPRHGERCQRVRTIEDVRSLRSPTPVEISAADFMFPNEDTCQEVEERRWIYVMVEDAGEADPQPVTDLGLSIDTQPPPNVGDPRLEPGENAAQLRWDLPNVRADDLYEYQVLCARADGTEGDEGFGDEPRYRTAEEVCGLETTFSPAPMSTAAASPGSSPVEPLQVDADPGAPDAESGDPGDGAGDLPDDLPEELRTLDSGAICGTETGATRTSLRVEDLENGVPYHVVLVGIDRARNPNPMYLGEVEPRPAIDFWDDYKGSGGTAEGGYCFVATAAFGGYDSSSVRVLRTFRDDTLSRYALGRAFIDGYYEHGAALAAAIEDRPVLRAAAAILLLPLVALTWVWNAAGLAGLVVILAAAFAIARLRRRAGGRREGPPGLRAAGAVAIAAVLCVPIGSASAQRGGFHDLQEPVDPPGPPDVAWNAELKAGGYFPAMDRNFDGTGPFESMFGGGPFLIGKLTVDRFFFYPGGQLGITGSVGYFSEGAQAFATDDDGNIEEVDGEPVRSEGDTTRFRMVPSALGVVYRYTQLDDALGIPLVPYGRLAMSYYLWWVTQPDGSIAQSGDDRARGGSFGWEGSVGLALRAERIDESAARNLKNEFGIEHAGFFVEGSYARVDSLGRDSRLPVGGLSVLGGINFEF